MLSGFQRLLLRLLKFQLGPLSLGRSMRTLFRGFVIPAAVAVALQVKSRFFRRILTHGISEAFGVVSVDLPVMLCARDAHISEP